MSDATRRILTTPATHVSHDEIDCISSTISRSVGQMARNLPTGGRIEIRPDVLRKARQRPDELGDEIAFAWTSSTVRRSLGLASIDACFRTLNRPRHSQVSPGDAVPLVADRAVRNWHETGERRFHWEPWLAGCTQGARAHVLADAVTWASLVWSSLDWEALAADTSIGCSTNRWSIPVTGAVRFRSRPDLMTYGRSDGGSGHARPVALVSFFYGTPSPGWDVDLAYLALVPHLSPNAVPKPNRVVGIWPEAAVSRSVDVDAVTLSDAGDLVIATVEALVNAFPGAVAYPPRAQRHLSGSAPAHEAA